MNKDRDLWQFVHDRIARGQPVMLLIVAESSGSSPGRRGYKMAVGVDGDLCGSIGGGVMEVNLVEQCRALLSEPEAVATGFFPPRLIEQVHQKSSPRASGMICSGRQTVILVPLAAKDSKIVKEIKDNLDLRIGTYLHITKNGLTVKTDGTAGFDSKTDADFSYTERLGHKQQLYIIGGGHCSLALSELMSKLDFRITIFDDRPELNTIEKNRFADEIRIIDSYEKIGGLIPSRPEIYVVVMTLGYASDEIAIRGLADKEFRYFGVLGSKAKMAVLLKSLEEQDIPPDCLARIHSPIGLPINSHTPEEIAVSIAAEIISVRNAP